MSLCFPTYNTALGICSQPLPVAGHDGSLVLVLFPQSASPRHRPPPPGVGGLTAALARVERGAWIALWKTARAGEHAQPHTQHPFFQLLNSPQN